MPKYPVVGLALGGGGARGLAHIGVIRVLQRHHIPFDLVTGSSMGAVVGAAYALLQDIDRLEALAYEMVEKVPQLEEMANVRQMTRAQRQVLRRFFNFMKELFILNLEATKKSLLDRDKVLPLLEDIFNRYTFADLKIPFGAVATDLRTGMEVLLREGELIPALLASSAIPGVFEPVEWDGYLLVDGCVTSTVPVEAARKMGADFIIAVNVEADVDRQDFDSAVEILFQVDDIRGQELNRLKLRSADVVIEPDIGHINWAQFSKIRECVQKGEQAAEAKVAQIKNKLAREKLKFWNIFR